jgi:hypothetical protein
VIEICNVADYCSLLGGREPAGFLPGVAGGYVPAIRQSVPSIFSPSLNFVTLQLDISPCAESADSEVRTSGSGRFMPVAISRSSSWPFFVRYCRILVACIGIDLLISVGEIYQWGMGLLQGTQLSPAPIPARYFLHNDPKKAKGHREKVA